MPSLRAQWGISTATPSLTVRRAGNTKTKSLMCVANLASLVVCFVVGEWKSYPATQALGMPDDGANFNRAVMAALIAASYLGWQSSGAAMPDVGLLGKPTASNSATALCYNAALCGLFGCMMIFNLDGLFESYGFVADGLLGKWMAMIFYGMAQSLISNLVASTCMLGADAKATADLMRNQSSFFGVLIASGCIGMTINQQLCVPDMPVGGQYFNLVLWFVGAALPFKAM